MNLFNRLKPYFFLTALALGLALVELLSPLDSADGFWLIVYGAMIGAWNQQLNPTVATQDDGPLIPWDEMRVGERLEYFLFAMSATALGVLVMTVSALSSGGLVENWAVLLAGLVMIAAGLGAGYWNWIHRYGTIESE